MSGEKLGSNNVNENNDWSAPGLNHPSSEWAALNTNVEIPESDRFASAPTGIPTAEKAMLENKPSLISYENNMMSAENAMLEEDSKLSIPRYENNMMSAENAMLEMSEEQQQQNLEMWQNSRETARDTVESILKNDAKMLEKVQKITFNDNIRSEFLRDYHEEISKVINENRNDFSDESSKKVNKFAEDYCKVIFMMDNLQRESGDRLVNVASNSYEITGEDGGLRQLAEFLQVRRKNGCNVEVAAPINYSNDNPHPKVDGVLIANWLDQRINQKEINTTNSTNALKAYINKNIQQ